jgi:hypothetical protein
MSDYRRIIAVVDLSARGLSAARHAWNQSLSNGAQFALGHVVDWDHGNGYSTITPSQIEDRLGIVVKRKLMEMADLIGAAGTQAKVSFKTPQLGLAEIIAGWQPDLLVLDRRLDFGLSAQKNAASLGWLCDVQIVDHPAGDFLPARFFQSLAHSFINRNAATP